MVAVCALGRIISVRRSCGWRFPPWERLLALLIARAILHPDAGRSARNPAAGNAAAVFWIYVAAAGLLACGFVDFPVLAFHFQKTACSETDRIPLLYAGAMGVNGLTALIFGRLFDRFGIIVLVIGTLISMLSLPLGFLGGPAAAVASSRLLGNGPGSAGRVAALRHRAGGLDEQTRQRVRRLQWSLRRAVVPGEVADGRRFTNTLLHALVALGVLAQFAAAVMFLCCGAP